MDDRINEELNLIRKYFPDAAISECRQWILIPEYKIKNGTAWNKEVIQVCVNIPLGHPGAIPYGIYVPSDLKYCGNVPGSFQQNAQNKPPFEGNWGMLSWSPVLGEWKPKADVYKGSNLYNFISTFKDRFDEKQ